MWLVGAAAWKEIRTRGNGATIVLGRGEFSFAIRFLAEKWQWSKSRVERFLNKLGNRDMIRDTSRDGSKVYSIKNYNRFQVVGVPHRDTEQDEIRDTSGTRSGQQRDKEETGETGKQESSLRSDSNSPPRRTSKRDEPPSFQPFWEIYPRKVSRVAAVKAYAKALSRASPEILLTGARRYATARANEDPQYTKHAATWLNQECWLDQEDRTNGANRNHKRNGASTSHQNFLEGALLYAGEGDGGREEVPRSGQLALTDEGNGDDSGDHNRAH